MNTLRFVTENKDKFEEARSILKDIPIKQYPMHLEEIQSYDVKEISEYKAKSVGDKPFPFFVEDTGLYIDALNGFPGPFAKQVFKMIGNRGILKLMEGEMNRHACFKAAVTYKDKTEMKTFEGETCGIIATKESGNNGFGYDPIFIPKGRTKTLAEMTDEEKNSLSHRARALRKMRKYIVNKELKKTMMINVTN